MIKVDIANDVLIKIKEIKKLFGNLRKNIIDSEPFSSLESEELINTVHDVKSILTEVIADIKFIDLAIGKRSFDIKSSEFFKTSSFSYRCDPKKIGRFYRRSKIAYIEGVRYVFDSEYEAKEFIKKVKSWNNLEFSS